MHYHEGSRRAQIVSGLVLGALTGAVVVFLGRVVRR